jgi:hypothetical protein
VILIARMISAIAGIGEMYMLFIEKQEKKEK